MSLIDVIILSIIEGITEFLPISSTGHLILTSHLLKIPQTEFVKTFEISIQLGAILAVVVLYAKRILHNLIIIPKILAAFIPTAVLGFLFYDFIKSTLFESIFTTVISLLLGGIALIALELFFERKTRSKPSTSSGNTNFSLNNKLSTLTYKQSLAIGLFQSISMIPGVSRAAATIFGGLFMGLSRTAAVEFSFLLAIPTMAAATGLDLIQTRETFSQNDIIYLLIGLFISFITALIVIKWLLKFIQTHTFIPFGIYRIVLAILFLLFML